MRRLFVGVLTLLAIGGAAAWWLMGRQSRPDSVSWQAVERDLQARFPTVATVSTDTLAAWLAGSSSAPPLVLDARAPEEYAVSHLPGARRVDPEAGAADVTAVLADRQPGQPVVVYCSVGVRSAGVAERLAAAGAEGVYNLEGSVFRWANEGRPLVRDGERVEEVHPYNALWGKLLDPAHRAALD